MDTSNLPPRRGVVTLNGREHPRQCAAQLLQSEINLESAVRWVLTSDTEHGVDRVRDLVAEVIATVEEERRSGADAHGAGGS